MTPLPRFGGEQSIQQNNMKHIDNLTRHIDLVRESCKLLGERLIDGGREEFGRQLIARGYCHDQSKFSGIEWEYLHVGDEVDSNLLKAAIKHHSSTNSHHPEYHFGIENMPEIDVAEMVCDWQARSQEFGNDLRNWVKEVAVEKYNISTSGKQYKWIKNFLDTLLQNSFKKNV